MSTSQIVFIGIYTLVLLVWLTRHLLINRIQRVTPFLTRSLDSFREEARPLVSVIIPAKDEEESIGDCVLSILEQGYLRLEVIVIDDRSADGTANIVRDIAVRDPRVRLISLTELPAGWTGKNNALATGANAARGDWLLFVDSDTRHEPENLSIMMEYARRERADMVSLLPRMRNGSFWESVLQPVAGSMLMLNYPLDQVNDDDDPSKAFANGQYILIRRKVYDAIGGHGAVRDKFVEDIHLARLLREKKYRVRLAIAPELTSTRMYTSFRDLVRGWSRILYAGFDCSAFHLGGMLCVLALVSLSSYVVLAATVTSWFMGHTSPFVSTLFGMCLVHMGLQFTVMKRAYAFTASERRYVVFYGLALLIMFGVFVTALLKCFTQQVVWRGTRYHKLEEAQPVILTMPTAGLVKPSEQRLRQSA